MDAFGFRLGRFSCSPGVLFAGALALYFGCSEILALSLVAAFLHELGHLAMCFLLGIPVYRLRLTLLGAELRLHSRSESGIEELFIALAGPLVNLLTVGILLAHPQPSASTLLFAGSSLLLGLFNLLPVSPLDGSRILHGFLSLWSLPVAERFTPLCTRIGCALLILPGLYCAWRGNPSLLAVAFWMSLSAAAPTGAAAPWRSFPK